MAQAGARFEPKNILLTGGAGFIASHVVIRLVNNYPQYKVRGPHRPEPNCSDARSAPHARLMGAPAAADRGAGQDGLLRQHEQPEQRQGQAQLQGGQRCMGNPSAGCRTACTLGTRR